MAANDKWARWESYQKTGKWPETAAQQKAREAKERELSESSVSESSHPALSSAQNAGAQSEPKVEEQEDHVAKVVRLWWAAHPELGPRPGGE